VNFRKRRKRKILYDLGFSRDQCRVLRGGQAERGWGWAPLGRKRPRGEKTVGRRKVRNVRWGGQRGKAMLNGDAVISNETRTARIIYDLKK